MTRPDARLLVPVASLPGGRAPGGCPAVMRDGRRVIVGGTYGLGAGKIRHVVIFVREGEAGMPSIDDPADLFLDLSRPDVVDGVPVRLDALRWALGVLGVRPTSLVNRAHNVPDCYRIKCPLFGAQGYIARKPWHRKSSRAFVLHDRWPDLTGLSDDDASRAVVAAALRGGA